MEIMKLTVMVLVVVALDATRRTAAAEAVLAVPRREGPPQQSTECLLLSSEGAEGFVAVARNSSSLGQPADDKARPSRARMFCSSGDNASCDAMCTKKGYRGGYCCCSCGAANLCACVKK